MKEIASCRLLFAVQKNNFCQNIKLNQLIEKKNAKSIFLSDGEQQPKPAQEHLQTMQRQHEIASFILLSSLLLQRK